VIDAFIQPLTEVIQALGPLGGSGASMESRPTQPTQSESGGACRCSRSDCGHTSKDPTSSNESLNRAQKIDDPSAGPGVEFLLHDLNEKVQIAALNGGL